MEVVKQHRMLKIFRLKVIGLWKLQVILQFKGQIVQQPEKVEKMTGKFKIIYKINGHDINGSDSCVIYRDDETAIHELIDAVNKTDLSKVEELIKIPRFLIFIIIIIKIYL